mmetsp:Transcript_8904/g.24207  ORF Transcript_8904/g.24207 Transcript_8904/m.24207 type:complete len:174 (+) Transcript_8904:2000-2521(+)
MLLENEDCSYQAFAEQEAANNVRSRDEDDEYSNSAGSHDGNSEIESVRNSKTESAEDQAKKATAEAEPTVRESATDNAGAEQEAVKVSRTLRMSREIFRDEIQRMRDIELKMIEDETKVPLSKMKKGIQSGKEFQGTAKAAVAALRLRNDVGKHSESSGTLNHAHQSTGTLLK